MQEIRKGYIYKISINNKVYIGQTIRQYKRRWYDHKWALKNNKHNNIHLQRAYNKYGENVIEFTLIEECEENIIDDREKYWIDFYESCDREKGYNIELGGNKNKIISEETKQKLREFFKGTRKGKENPMYGKKLPTERIEEIRLMNQGSSDKLTEEDVSRIKKLLIKDVKMKDIAKKFNVDYTTISKINTCVNWYWVLPELNERIKTKLKKEKITRDKNIIDLNKSGLPNNKIAERLEIDNRTVSRVLKSKGLQSPIKTKHNQDTIRKIVELHKKGINNYIIAEELDISLNSVSKYIIEHGYSGKRIGSKSHNSKLTEKDIPEIRKYLSEGKSTTYIAELFGVKRQTITDIKFNRTWKHVI